MQAVVPTEQYEQEQLVLWLAARNYLFCASLSGMHVKSPAARAKNFRAGLRPGVPDLLIMLKNGKPLFIELKRVKGGRASPAQIKWIEALTAAGVDARICCGAESAKKLIDDLEKTD